MSQSSVRDMQRLARRKREHHQRQLQRALTERLRREISRLLSRANRGDRQAAKQLKEGCASSFEYRRLYSSLIAEGKRGLTRVGPGDFTPGGRPVQGGRVSPR